MSGMDNTSNYSTTNRAHEMGQRDAKIKKVYKGEKSVKGKKIKLKSSNGECGVDDMLKPGPDDFILGFKSSKEDVRDEVIEVSLCSFFKMEQNFLDRISSIYSKDYSPP